jgi:hypothetical protein
MWSALSWPGLEHLTIREEAGAIEMDGLVVAHVDGASLRLRYRLSCEASWATRRLDVTRHDAAPLVFEADGAGRWTNGAGQDLPELAGSVDVDIALTPFTNTLPIRRLPWRVGQARDLLMVYVAVPEMTYRQARQRYTCLESGVAGAVFRYESGSFRADLEVDQDGLVVDYPGFWRRAGVES